MFDVEVGALESHAGSAGRFEIATLEDPEYSDCGCTLSVVVRAGEFAAGGRAFLIVVGAKVPDKLAVASGWESLLLQSDNIVRPSYFGSGCLSQGLLLPCSVVRRITCDDHDCGKADPYWHTAALGVAWPSPPAARIFVLDIGFDGSFSGSQYARTESLRPTVLGQFIKATDGLGLSSKPSDWVTLSRVDSGVSARSFKLATPKLAISDPGELFALLPRSIRVHQMLPKPLGASWGPGQAVSREYGYYVPTSAAAGLHEILQMFVGRHCFCNFTSIKKLDGLKKNIQKSQELQVWARQVQNWKRAEKTDCISSLPVHRAMRSLCYRRIFSIECRPSGHLTCIRIKGDGFLYHMIRFMVGSALAVLSGQLAMSNLRTAVAGKVCVDLSSYLAPAHGLVLLEQSLSHDWLARNSEKATASADDWLEERILPSIEEAWQPQNWIALACLLFSRMPSFRPALPLLRQVNILTSLGLACTSFKCRGLPRGSAALQSLG